MHLKSNLIIHFQSEDPAFSWESVRYRMRNINNLKIIPLDLEELLEWSPAREVWAVHKEELKSSIWRVWHLSQLVR